ncbi:fimbria/pilus outer membrane usher protein [Klebsiella pneumoniae subsp. pneumoniae]|nr:fimbria/pilus outer membrane usher protein [Klebsiella pneumoniae subsp. pneumoniae]
MNTGIGALSFDVTHSRLKSDTLDEHGQSYRATFNRMFTETRDQHRAGGVSLLHQRLLQPERRPLRRRSGEELQQQLHRVARKNGMTFTVNQNLPDGWGGFYLSGRVADYWNRSGTEKQYQFSYNNMYGRLVVGQRPARLYPG